MTLFIILLVIIAYLSIGKWLQWSTQSDFKGIIWWWLPLVSIMWLIRKKWLPFGCISCEKEPIVV